MASKFRAAGAEPAVFQDDEHHFGGHVDVGRELVGVPAEKHIAGVGIDRTEKALAAGEFEFMLDTVPASVAWFVSMFIFT